MHIVKNSIRTKIMALAILSITLGTLLIGSFSYITAWNAIDHKLKTADLLNLVKYQAENINGRISKSIETSITLANDPTMVKWFQQGEKDPSLGLLVKEKFSNIKVIGQVTIGI